MNSGRSPVKKADIIEQETSEGGCEVGPLECWQVRCDWAEGGKENFY